MPPGQAVSALLLAVLIGGRHGAGNLSPGMIAIVIFGAGMVALSVGMVVKPEAWARAAVRFTRLRFMHPFEIVTRIGFGALFVLYADQTKFPTLIRVLGYALLAVGVALLFTPPRVHRRFGVWCVEKTARFLRPAGLASLAFGIFLIYAAF